MNNSSFTAFQRLSISKKLSLWYGLSLFILLSVFAYFLYQTFHSSIHHNYDRHLRYETEQIIPFLKTSTVSLGIDLTLYSRNEALMEEKNFGTYVRLFDAQKNLLYQSPNFNKHSKLPVKIPSISSQVSLSTTWQDLPLRTYYHPIINYDNKLVGWLEVSGFEWTLHEELVRLRKYLILLVTLSVVFSILGGYWLSKKALSPISSITSSVNSIKASELQKRIPANPEVEDELTELSHTFNMMLSRLQKAFEREKRFTADAAHELSNPLASIRNEVEVTLRKPRENEEYEATLGNVHQETIRMSSIIESLLQLSTVEANEKLDFELININDVLTETISRFTVRIAKKDLDLVANIDSSVKIKGKKEYLEEVFGNLISNAVKYSDPGKTISITLKKKNNAVQFTIKDEGYGFDSETKKRLFDRFYRSDQPSVQQEAGSGLGLALVKAIVELFEGTIKATSKGISKGSTVTVQFPLKS
jgi:signal transduction histidine kinase